MRGYGQFCPIAKAAEIFAERWTPLIMREILLGSRHFNEVERGVPRISRSVLAQRLKALEDAGLVERRGARGGRNSEYVATPAGQELFDVIYRLGVWGARWMNREVAKEDTDVDLLVWDMHRRFDLERVPRRRVIVQLDFTGSSRKRFWFIVQPEDVSACVTNPGFEVDLRVTADTLTLHRVWVGHTSMEVALKSRAIVLEGPAELRRAFPSWLQLSVFAATPPAEASSAPTGRRSALQTARS